MKAISTMYYYRIAFVSWLAMCVVIPASAAEFSVSKQEDGVTINLGGQLFTRYVYQSGTKPILWPIIGPTGTEVTRGYPMRDATENENPDHIHHRSLWFTHGDVNGTSFWDEGGRHGTIKHRELVQADGGPEAVLVTGNDWLDADEKTVCQDVTRLTFGANAESRWIDYDITITAGAEAVKFGDTKEGTFGVRVAGTMKVNAKRGGRIVNSAGQTDDAAWGKAASWVDYHGPVEGETVGIAIMNHPSSFRFPTYWHVRTYGLFAANPFGRHNFQNSDEVDGAHTLEPGQSISLRYRVLIHKGDEKDGHVADAFGQYAKVNKDGS